MKGKLGLVVSATVLSIAAGACTDLEDGEASKSLQAEYAEATKESSQTKLLVETAAVAGTVGLAAGVLPSLIKVGNPTADLAVDAGILLADAAVVSYLSYRLIYGTGAVAARSLSCPHLVERGDFESVLGFLFSGADKEKLAAFVGKLPPYAGKSADKAARRAAAKLLQEAIRKTAPRYIGAHGTGMLMSQLTLKKLAAWMPWIGGPLGMAVNGFVIHQVEKAATAYYQAKSQAVCKAGTDRKY